MKFETQFDKGERVWFMKDDKPIEVIISAIEIFHVNTNQDYTKYNARNINNSTSWLDHKNLFENVLFKTKGGLLKSLFGSDGICKGKNCNALNGIGHSDECVQEHNQYYIEEAEIPEFEGTRKALNNIGIE